LIIRPNERSSEVASNSKPSNKQAMNSKQSMDKWTSNEQGKRNQRQERFKIWL